MWKILKFLPRKELSRLTGKLVHFQGPTWWNSFLIRTFAGFYKIDLNEAELPVSSYSSLGEFFVRRLKSGTRPLGNGFAVHPADSRILQAGPIREGFCLQAKGKNYSVREFLVDDQWKDKYEGGTFITYYLCPTDYHRVHSPVSGVITKVTYVPGDLWPVHDSAVNEMEGLYLVNERAAVEVATELGMVAVVFVGATNVGSIHLAFDKSVVGNEGLPFQQKLYGSGKEIAKGEELGMFRMGSTVIVLYPRSFTEKYGGALKLGPLVKVNSALTV